MHHPGLINKHTEEIAEANGRANNANQDDVNQSEAEIAAKMKLCFMISGLNNGRYGELKDYLENRYTFAEANEYPQTTTRLRSAMNNLPGAPRKNYNRQLVILSVLVRLMFQNIHDVC